MEIKSEIEPCEISSEVFLFVKKKKMLQKLFMREVIIVIAVFIRYQTWQIIVFSAHESMIHASKRVANKYSFLSTIELSRNRFVNWFYFIS